MDLTVVVSFLLVLASAVTHAHGHDDHDHDYEEPGTCTNTNLGMEDGRIHDSQITASSTWVGQIDTDHSTSNARLNRPGVWPDYTGSWSAQTNDVNQWIQVSFGEQQLISGVITQGRSSTSGDPHTQYVTEYKVQYSDDGNHWHYVTDRIFNQVKEFLGNSDRETPVRNLFDSPVKARYVRIRPTAWRNHISMRFELIGCEGKETKTEGLLKSPPGICGKNQLGMEDGRIADSQITASTVWPTAVYDLYVDHSAHNARLNRESNWPEYTGGWVSAYKDTYQWIQVAFDKHTWVSGVVTQGRSTTLDDPYDMWVTSFKVEYSNDNIEWEVIRDSNDEEVEFKGNRDRETPVTNMFPTPVRTTYIRIRPTAWNSHISMRFELLGCQVKGFPMWAIGAIVASVVIVAMVVLLIYVIVYAYRNPASRLGRGLIQAQAATKSPATVVFDNKSPDPELVTKT